MFGHTENPIPRPPSRVVAFHRRGKKPHPGVLSTTLTMVRASSRARETTAREGGGGDDGARGHRRTFRPSFVRSVGRSLARSVARSLARSTRRIGGSARVDVTRFRPRCASARERGRETDASEARVIERVHRNDAFDDAVGDDVARARGGGDGDDESDVGRRRDDDDDDDARRARRTRRGTGDDVGRARTRRRR